MRKEAIKRAKAKPKSSGDKQKHCKMSKGPTSAGREYQNYSYFRQLLAAM